MNELSDKERAERYKELYNIEYALRLDLEKEVEYLNNTIWNREYSTPEKIAEDYIKHIAEQKKSYIVGHKEVQEAIDKTVKYLSEIRPDSLKVSAVEHLKQLYKIQIAILGRLDIQ
jgi:hypothetical protein